MGMELRKQIVIRKILLAALLIATSVACFAQQVQKSKRANSRFQINPLINKNKPPVFLTFLRKERVEPRNGLEDPNPVYLFFKLTNNTRWPVWLDMSGTTDSDPRYGEVDLYREIDDSKSGQRISGRLYCHACSFNPLRPGSSVVFSIPAEDAARERNMRVRYEFNWEQSAKYNDDSNLHTVAFYFRQLPKNILEKAPLNKQ